MSNTFTVSQLLNGLVVPNPYQGRKIDMIVVEKKWVEEEQEFWGYAWFYNKDGEACCLDLLPMGAYWDAEVLTDLPFEEARLFLAEEVPTSDDAEQAQAARFWEKHNLREGISLTADSPEEVMEMAETLFAPTDKEVFFGRELEEELNRRKAVEAFEKSLHTEVTRCDDPLVFVKKINQGHRGFLSLGQSDWEIYATTDRWVVLSNGQPSEKVGEASVHLACDMAIHCLSNGGTATYH